MQYNTDMSLARQEGLEQGRTEGEAAATIKLARAMKAEGIDFKAISRMTGMSDDDIQKL